MPELEKIYTYNRSVIMRRSGRTERPHNDKHDNGERREKPQGCTVRTMNRRP